MNQQEPQYFVLIVPGCLLLLGLAFLLGRWILRDQRFLSWVAAGYIIPSLALSAQSLMTNAQLADWSVVIATFYLFGSWAVAQGMAVRNGSHAHPCIALLIAAITLALLFYFSHIDDRLWFRIVILNAGIALVQLLAVRSLFARPTPEDLSERVLNISYSVSIAYTLARPLVVYSFVPAVDMDNLTRSNLWLLMLATSVLLCLWFALVVFAITVRDILLKVSDERYRDSLTLLLNRRGFFESAKIFMSQPGDQRYFLLVCDIDHFKHINDNWGHLEGDQVLQVVSRTLLTNVRGGDLVARFGGEEFVMLMKGNNMTDASSLAERIRYQLEQTTFSHSAEKVTGSFGLVEVISLPDLPAAIGRADALLYQAKNAGRNQICVTA